MPIRSCPIRLHSCHSAYRQHHYRQKPHPLTLLRLSLLRHSPRRPTLLRLSLLPHSPRRPTQLPHSPRRPIRCRRCRQVAHTHRSHTCPPRSWCCTCRSWQDRPTCRYTSRCTATARWDKCTPPPHKSVPQNTGCRTCRSSPSPFGRRRSYYRRVSFRSRSCPNIRLGNIPVLLGRHCRKRRNCCRPKGGWNTHWHTG
jgi:hypothetical protein